MKAYLGALRLKTLPAALVPVVFAGGLIARRGQMLPWGLLLATLLSALCIQVATNFFNDALDADQGADGPQRLGPTRATASGQLTRKQVMMAGWVFVFFASVFGLPLVWARGWVIVAIGLPSLYLAYAYTGGPLRLAYRGLGELFVLVFFGWVAVLGSIFVLGGNIDATAWALGSSGGGLSCALIAINNLRDHQGDKAAGKMTLAARFGPLVGRLIVSLSILGGYLALGVAELALGGERLPFYLLPSLLGIFIIWAVWSQAPSRHFNRFLGLAGLQLLLVAFIFSWPCP